MNYKVTSKNSTKRRSRDETMNIIKNITLKILEEKGYSYITMNKISKETGINISLIYRYFPKGLSDILQAIGLDLINSIQEEKNIQHFEDPRNLLKNIIMYLIELHRKRAKVLNSLLITYLSDPESFIEQNKVLIADTSDLNIFHRLLPKLGYDNKEKIVELGKLMMHIVDSLVHRHVLVVPIIEPDEKLAEMVADILMTYIKNEEQKSQLPI